MLARDYFESVARSVRDCRACQRQLKALVKEDTRCARAARERLQSRIESDLAIIDRAGALIYGGVFDANPDYAHIMWWRYIDDAKWEKFGHMVGCSKWKCQRDNDRALAAIDSLGLLDGAAV